MVVGANEQRSGYRLKGGVFQSTPQLSEGANPCCNAVSGLSSRKQSEAIQTISVCELTTHPELYENKVVRVEAIYFAIHVAQLYDKKCYGKKTQSTSR